MPTYRVKITYRVSKELSKLYSITYEIEAPNRRQAERKALTIFAEYEKNMLASWVRLVEDIKVYKKVGGEFLTEEDEKKILEKLVKTTGQEFRDVLKKIAIFEIKSAAKYLYQRFFLENDTAVKREILNTLLAIMPDELPSLAAMLEEKLLAKDVLKLAEVVKFRDKETLIKLFLESDDLEMRLRILKLMTNYDWEIEELKDIVPFALGEDSVLATSVLLMLLNKFTVEELLEKVKVLFEEEKEREKFVDLIRRTIVID